MTAISGAIPFPNLLNTIVAHQGGWDEILLVATPLALIGVLLWIANRRVEARLADESAEPTPAETTAPDGTDEA